MQNCNKLKKLSFLFPFVPRPHPHETVIISKHGSLQRQSQETVSVAGTSRDEHSGTPRINPAPISSSIIRLQSAGSKAPPPAEEHSGIAWQTCIGQTDWKPPHLLSSRRGREHFMVKAAASGSAAPAPCGASSALLGPAQCSHDSISVQSSLRLCFMEELVELNGK